MLGPVHSPHVTYIHFWLHVFVVALCMIVLQWGHETIAFEEDGGELLTKRK
jgi:hypothetical protein